MITDTQINTTIQGNQSQPSITTLINGGFVVSWTSGDQDGNGSGIYAQRYDENGVKQSSEFHVNTYTLGSQFSPEITALNDGGFVVSWESYDQDGSGSGIYAQRFDENGVAQGSEFRVNTFTLGSQSLPAITALNDGGFVVSWTSWSTYNNYGINAQRFNANGEALGSEFRVNTSIIGDKWSPAITALNDGSFVVCWTSVDQDGSRDGIYAQRYDKNGVAHGSEFLVNTYTYEYQRLSAITALNDGGFVVSWTSFVQDGSSEGIYAQRYDENSVAQGSEFRVNTYTIGYQSTPSIAALNDGGFVVSWTSDQDGDSTEIYAQRYDVNGVAQGNEFHVNTNTIGDQFSSVITALSDGGFIVSWVSPDQDGDDSGIFAHRYNAAGNEIGWTLADRVFNWAEDVFPDLLPKDAESIELFDYYLRIYENGNVLGELNDNIYFYDSNSVSIIFVGVVNDYLSDAVAAGF